MKLNRVYVFKSTKRISVEEKAKCCADCSHCKSVCFRGSILRVCDLTDRSVMSYDVCPLFNAREPVKGKIPAVKPEKINLDQYKQVVLKLNEISDADFRSYEQVHKLISAILESQVNITSQAVRSICFKLMVAYRAMTE